MSIDITPDEAAELNTRLVIAIDVASLVSKRLRFIAQRMRRKRREGGTEPAERIDRALLELASVADELLRYRKG